jgi:hypothetical protein
MENMQRVTTWKKRQKKKQRSRILRAYENKNILHTWRWLCRPKHVVKHNKAAHRRKHNLQNPLNCVNVFNELLSGNGRLFCFHSYGFQMLGGHTETTRRSFFSFHLLKLKKLLKMKARKNRRRNNERGKKKQRKGKRTYMPLSLLAINPFPSVISPVS